VCAPLWPRRGDFVGAPYLVADVRGDADARGPPWQTREVFRRRDDPGSNWRSQSVGPPRTSALAARFDSDESGCFVTAALPSEVDAQTSFSASDVGDLSQVKDETVPLQDALRAAQALTNGEVVPEEAVGDAMPWLLDVTKVLARLRPADALAPWFFGGFNGLGGRGRQGDQRGRAAPSAKPLQGSARRREKVAPLDSAAVLFGTADALVSETMLPPLLTWP